ncbi:PD-(D/E)XK nuclease family protein [Bacteroidota bacterium]
MFLEKLANYILEENISLESTCFVFPNRRSGLFFKRFLSNRTEHVTWAPTILTINELMQDLSDLDLVDNLEVLFLIHDIYATLTEHPESFDSYYPWAEMMLGDFDHLDKYLVDPVSLFKNVRDLKEIDEQFGDLEEEQVEFIRQFWKSFHQGDTSAEKEVFLSTWMMLPGIYKEVMQQLLVRGKAYEGLMYRKAAEMDTLALDERLSAEHYYFVGFNALSTSERKIFSLMKSMQRASFFWDYDEQYLRDDSMEAGRFLRENLAQFPPPVDLEIFDSLSGERDIRIFDLPSDILQAKTVSKLLKEKQRKVSEANDTAVIACDENLLMPLLHSLPENIEMVNVTMGYPFSNTPLNSFLESLLRLHKNIRRKGDGKALFYHRDVLSVLNHQYFKIVSDANPSILSSAIIAENHIYIAPEYFMDEFSRLIFRITATVDEFGEYLQGIIDYLVRKLSAEVDAGRNQLDLEYLLVILSKLNILNTQFQSRTPIALETYIRILRKILKNLRIPFTGEPLAGLQVMGILETRLLDFEHIIMLSVNEDIMPNSSTGHSFIPYSLRYAYGMPTREEQDAIYAYYFYRAIQRARKVDLLFKSASDGVKTGEMSRYLYQLKYSYNAKIIRPVLPVTSSEIYPIEVEKGPEIQEILSGYLMTKEEGPYLSPSSLNMYIECSLKFYFRKILHIGEQDVLLEELDPIGFGNILHRTIHRLYQHNSENGRKINKAGLETIISGSDLDGILLQEFKKEFFKGKSGRNPEGRNLIILAILKRYVLQILSTDIQIAPFTLLELEKEYKHSLEIEFSGSTMVVRIGGQIDRVDMLESGIVRIIDYKTGNPDQRLESIASLFDSQNKNRNKEAFQAFVYATLFLAKEPGRMVQPGLYVTRKLFEKNFTPLFTFGKGEENTISSFNSFYEEFLNGLKQVVMDLFDPAIPFRQTAVIERCEYCDFKEICQRV